MILSASRMEKSACPSGVVAIHRLDSALRAIENIVVVIELQDACRQKMAGIEILNTGNS
jgi:hypothetical protein